jgi:aspartate carbamoyltransferase catalytic subunit
MILQSLQRCVLLFQFTMSITKLTIAIIGQIISSRNVNRNTNGLNTPGSDKLTSLKPVMLTRIKNINAITFTKNTLK